MFLNINWISFFNHEYFYSIFIPEQKDLKDDLLLFQKPIWPLETFFFPTQA